LIGVVGVVEWPAFVVTQRTFREFGVARVLTATILLKSCKLSVMTSRQISWILGGLLLGAIIWIVQRTVGHIQGHTLTIMTACAFVLIGGLLGWIAVKILRIK
jgi:hypothetical protein